MLRPGLVSVTFRALSPAQIVELCVQNQLEGIEWGGDVHVPHAELATARQVAQMTRDAGLEVVCYGSYYRCDGSDFEPELETALELGASVIRVWAGRTDAHDATPADFARILADLERIAALAPDHTIALEYHGGTLTSQLQSTLELLELAPSNVKTLWQPLRRARDFDPQIEENLAELEAVKPFLEHVHVYEWAQNADNQKEALPLENSTQWPIYVQKLREISGNRWLLLEFLPDGAPQNLAREAAALRELLKTPAAH